MTDHICLLSIDVCSSQSCHPCGVRDTQMFSHTHTCTHGRSMSFTGPCGQCGCCVCTCVCICEVHGIGCECRYTGPGGVGSGPLVCTREGYRFPHHEGFGRTAHARGSRGWETNHRRYRSSGEEEPQVCSVVLRPWTRDTGHSGVPTQTSSVEGC